MVDDEGDDYIYTHCFAGLNVGWSWLRRRAYIVVFDTNVSVISAHEYE